MDKANVIISVIIVLCIAAAVAAYGLTNTSNPIFSDLSSMGANTNGNGLGNNSTHHNISSVATTSGSNGGSSSGAGSSSDGGYSSGGGYSGGSSDSGSGYDGGSSDSGGGSDSGGSSSGTHLSYSEAQSIANSAVSEPGCYAGGVYYSGGVWHATIYDEDGNAVDGITIDDATGSVGRG